MYFEQILRRDIGCAAYMVGSASSGEVAVIDPRIDMVDEILDLMARDGLRLRYIIETHNHADHVAGHHQLAARTGADIAIFHTAGVEYPHQPLQDEQELALGEVKLRVIHTPGHRPEHIAIAVIDRSRGDEPWVVLTGDSLFIGDVARPDLAIPGEEGAEALFLSLHARLLTLADGTLVYPGHIAGSLCGRVNNRMATSTIGFERSFNPALAIPTVEPFVIYMTGSLPERPPNMTRIVDMNRAAGPVSPAEPLPLPASEVRRLAQEGSLVLDTRTPGEFGAGHIPGAISAYPGQGQFQNRVGLTVSPDADLVLVTSEDALVAPIVESLSVIGYNRVTGYLAGDMRRWELAGFDTMTLPQISVRALQQEREQTPELQVLDVREPGEWKAGHIEGAIHIPFYRVAANAGTLDRKRPLAVICGSGVRSSLAASLLQRAGFTDLRNVTGGMGAWNAASLPTVQSGDEAGTRRKAITR
jgi:glyoxylase-like metal-dependent hydrolase (beta-lactamase superfamily II)/rhodanese-related sulfurtransferase